MRPVAADTPEPMPGQTDAPDDPDAGKHVTRKPAPPGYDRFTGLAFGD